MQLKRIPIALTYDEWAPISEALARHAETERCSYLLAAAANIERSIGNTAVAGILELAVIRMTKEEEASALPVSGS